jgi:peptidoglycan/LPS O-acetylase OafA/YrhL
MQMLDHVGRAVESTARPNNFDLLRLAFAGSVMLFHIPTLSGEAELRVLSQAFSADIAVKAFFVISGYLVMMSWERSASLRDYAGKRVRRIYPAYAAVVLLCALVGAWLTVAPVEAYFGADLARYCAANLAFLNFLAPTLPGVFDGQPFSEVNGALWTLKIEVMYYLCVPALAWTMTRLGRWRTLMGLYALSLAWVLAMRATYAAHDDGIWLQLERQLPGQLRYFLVGVAWYFVRDTMRWRVWIGAAALAAFIATRVAVMAPLNLVLEPIALGTLVIFAANGLPYLGNLARFGDLSYGVYIIHFPVIQTAVWMGLFVDKPWSAAVLSIALVVAAAALSWHAVERPFLERRSHYRLAERERESTA